MSKLIKDVFTAWMTTGAIFNAIGDATGYVPVWDGDIDEDILDIQYIGNRSGDKQISPLVEKLLTSDGVLDSTGKNTLAEVLINLYDNKWKKLYAVLSLEYNPIENYDRLETHTGTDTETQTPTNWKETSTQTPDDWTTTQTQTPTDWTTTVSRAAADNQSTTDTSVYGFNSSTASPERREVTSDASKSETEQSGTFETSTEQTGTFETEVSRTGTYETEMEYDTELHIRGNIGLTTSQQMMQSEIELWQWNFFESVFKDIDRVLTLPIYN